MVATIKDIAEKAEVSTATVSYVLNNTGNISPETRKKVLKVIEALNYKPNQIAKSLKLKKTKTIGVIVEDITVFNAAEIIDGINEYAEKIGYSIILTNMRLFKMTGNNFFDIEKCSHIAMKKMDELLSNEVDGIIYIGVHPRDVTGVLTKVDKPIVYTYCYTTSEKDFAVNYDDEQASYEATKYLINLGHKKIGLISGLIDSIPTHARYTGYYRALREHNLIFDPSFIKTGDWEFESGYAMAKEILAQDNVPTAILAMNDLMAGGVIEACKDVGLKVPEDLSVVGFDNRELSMFYSPNLSTVDLPLHEMGTLSMEILVKVLNNQPVSVNEVKKLKCKFIKRNSVSAYKNELIV